MSDNSKWMGDCIFCKIRDGAVPSERLHDDDEIMALRDIAPQAPTHMLIVPKRHFASLAEATEEDGPLVGKMHLVAARLARATGLDAYRTVLNTGAEAGQSVLHLHLHLLGGRKMNWPPG